MWRCPARVTRQLGPPLRRRRGPDAFPALGPARPLPWRDISGRPVAHRYLGAAEAGSSQVVHGPSLQTLVELTVGEDGWHTARLRALAHDRALVVYQRVRDATRSQYWMLAVMVAFTSLGLWLLSVR